MNKNSNRETKVEEESNNLGQVSTESLVRINNSKKSVEQILTSDKGIIDINSNEHHEEISPESNSLYLEAIQKLDIIIKQKEFTFDSNVIKLSGLINSTNDKDLLLKIFYTLGTKISKDNRVYEIIAGDIVKKIIKLTLVKSANSVDGINPEYFENILLLTEKFGENIKILGNLDKKENEKVEIC